MKFYCDACNTKYAISDDKVRGKVLKVRCKSCGHIITVRENMAPVTAARPAEPAAPKRPVAPAAKPPIPPNNWYYALNGATSGPFDLEVLRRKYASGEVGDETYVWHDTFPAWKPVTEVDAFAEALAKGRAQKPRSKTIGFTGPIQAIDASAAPKPEDRKAAAPEPTPAPTPDREQSAGQEAEREQETAHELVTADVLRSEGQKPEPSAEAPAVAEPAPEPEAEEVDEPDEAAAGEADAGGAEVEDDADDAEESPQIRKDRLDKLRARLKSPGSSRPLPSRPVLPKKQAAAADAELDLSDVLPDVDEKPAPKAEPKDAAGEKRSQLPFVNAGAKRPAARGAEEQQGDGEEAAVDPVADTVAPAGSMFGGEVGAIAGHGEDSARISFDLPPTGGAASRGAGAARDDADEGEDAFFADSADPAGAEEDPGAVPFFPDAPKLSSSAPGVAGPSPTDSITGSLLIQLDQIKKTGRGKLVGGVLAAVVIIAGVVGAGVYMGIVNPKEELVVEAAPKVEQRDELVIRRYSKSEQNRFAQIDLGAEVLTEEDLAAEELVEEEAVEAAEAPARRPSAAEKRESKSEDAFEAAVASARQARADREEAEKAAAERKAATAGAAGGGAKPASAARLDRAPTLAKAEAPSAASNDKPEGSEVNAKSVLAYRAAAESPSREAAVVRPDDPLAARQQGGGELTREMAVAGFKKVRRSVALCRERHMRRGATLDAQKIYVTVHVEGDGQVTKFSVKPAAVQNTTFEQCMQSHKGRWRFPPYGGKPTTINSSFIIQ